MARVGFLIVGSPRSGTTLVQRLACEIPGVSVPIETHFFTRGLAIFRDRGGFPQQDSVLLGSIEEYVRIPQLEGAGVVASGIFERLHARANNALEVFDAVVSELAGDAELLGEKTPGHLPWVGRLVQARPDLRVVAVVREPRAVVASQLGVSWGQAPVDLLALRWLDDQQVVVALGAELGHRMLTLRYEDVVADPARARTLIRRTLGRNSEGGTDARVVGDELRTEAGSAVRPESPLYLPWETWKHDAGGEIRQDRVSSWAEALSTVEAERVNLVCGSLLERFGYPRPRLCWARRARLALSAPRGTRRRSRALLARRAALRDSISSVDLGIR